MRIQLPPQMTWHRWFAWYPVRANDQLVWLEYVNRWLCRNAYYPVRYSLRDTPE